MPLTDTAIKHAKARDKTYALTDGRGLSLEVLATGSKRWNFRFQWCGKQQRISFGTYPEISLKDARQRREDARTLVAKGTDPRVHRRVQRQRALQSVENTFEAVSARWQLLKAKALTDAKRGSADQAAKYLKKDMLPALGKISITEITRRDVLDVIRSIERRGSLVSARKVCTWFNQIFRFAMAEGLIDTNPAADLDIVVEPPKPVQHNPYLKVDELHGLLRELDSGSGIDVIRLGVRLLLLTGVRTGELRAATPDQFDLDRGLWLVPQDRIKNLRSSVRTSGGAVPPYIVPLSSQAIDVVRQLLSSRSRAARHLLVHRSDSQAMISEGTLNLAIKRMGCEARLTGHGIRATISTALNEAGFEADWIEAQLSHAGANPIRAAYNHAAYVEQRRQMMQYWADLLDSIKNETSHVRADLQDSL